MKPPRFGVALLAAALALPLPSPAAAGAPIAPVPIRDARGAEIGLYRESFALVIGAAEYTAGWPRLPGVKADVAAVRAALEAQGFTVELVFDPTGEQLQKAFREFISRRGLAPENRLLFWFAGHGYSETKNYGREMGYIVPVDAPLPERDRAGFLNSALSMQRMDEYARQIEAKHAIFLFDSCFSGQLFAVSRSAPEQITYKTSLPVRQFLTAGGADEQVSDRSVFREQFEAALAGEADRNGDGYVTGTELGEFLQEKVIRYSRGSQHPQYGKINDATLDKGDFVFPLPGRGEAPPGPDAAVPAAPVRGAAQAPAPAPAAPPQGYDVRRDPALAGKKPAVDLERAERLAERFQEGQFSREGAGGAGRPAPAAPQPESYLQVRRDERGGCTATVRIENASGAEVVLFAEGQDPAREKDRLGPGQQRELPVRVEEGGGAVVFVAEIGGRAAATCRWVYTPGVPVPVPAIRYRGGSALECDAGRSR
jgi:hypothetical protein